MGQMTPQTISSYNAQLVGITPMFAMTMAKIRAMIAPETLEAHRYFCSNQIDRATEIHMTPKRPQVSSAAIRVRPINASNNIDFSS